jgi:hypothetical protein
MADFLPGWYKGSEYINVEDLFKDYFTPLLPDVNVTHWIRPIDYGYIPGVSDGAEPTLRFWRQPGQRDYETKTDIPLLQAGAITRSHDESWELIEFVSSMMNLFNLGLKIVRPNGSQIQPKNVKLWMGPQILPEGPVDHYFVPMTWQFTLPGYKLQPDYYTIVKNLLP